MLPKTHIFAYQEFLSALELLKKETTGSQSDPTSLSSHFQQVQNIFQEKIITLTNDDLEQEITPNLQAINTELHRELRLLSTSIMFLRSSRSSATSQVRLTAIIERLNTLIASCQLLMDH